jgi:hypothetical protein
MQFRWFSESQEIRIRKVWIDRGRAICLLGHLFQNYSLTDAGLTLLEELASLRTLALPGTSISDAGIISLASLTDLQYLD